MPARSFSENIDPKRPAPSKSTHDLFSKHSDSTMPGDLTLRADLHSIYEEVMWLSRRQNVTPGRARSWYTHVMAESVKRRLRMFTGFVSAVAVADIEGPLTLEHFLRIQTALSALVERHRQASQPDPNEFIDLLIKYERVHVVTRAENYAAMRAKGDYGLAGIALVPWTEIPPDRRRVLWRTMLRGKVANASAFE